MSVFCNKRSLSVRVIVFKILLTIIDFGRLYMAMNLMIGLSRVTIYRSSNLKAVVFETKHNFLKGENVYEKNNFYF